MTLLSLLFLTLLASLSISCCEAIAHYRRVRWWGRIERGWEDFPPRRVIEVHEGPEAPF